MKLTFGEAVGGTRLSMSQDEALVLIRQLASMVQDCSHPANANQPNTESWSGVISEKAGKQTIGRFLFSVWPNGRAY